MREHRGPSSAGSGPPAEAPILGVLFVDIADSTRLYRTLGDVRAREIVLGCLARLSDVVTRLGGRIIDSIGDELMCTFDTAVGTIEAAVALQHAVTARAREDGADINVRIGLAVGPVVRDGPRVFGKTVYTAKRMASLAKTRQVVTTGDTAARLDQWSGVPLRFVDRVVLKGDQSVTEVFEVLWDPESATDRSLDPADTATRACVRLHYAGRELVVDESHPEITMGRGETCDLVVPGPDVSWLHARIQCWKGRPTLIDVSTNGTFVLPDGAAISSRVHRDTVSLTGGGQLGLGRPPLAGNDSRVTFACRIEP